jgi:prepilin-type N-terminal cleavage/methylation domain-containing protein
MNPGHDNSANRSASWRRLPVAWLEPAGSWPLVFLSHRRMVSSACPRRLAVRRWLYGSRAWSSRPDSRAFTILEMMIVIGIIGLMAAMTLPHLSGFAKGNTITGATRQLLDDVGLARQRAIANRSEVCMVFLPPNFWVNDQNQAFSNSQMTGLVGHQYAAYALISMRTVGDQPGKSNAHYLTDWKPLPQGIYFYPWQLTNGYALPSTNLISTRNTTIGNGLSNGWNVTSFPTNILFPFPSTASAGTSNYLPYLAFSPSGQLISGSDQFIALSSGSIFYPLDASGNPQWTPGAANAPIPVETPPGNVSNNANLIHIDWLTARSRLEHNQF